MLLANEMPTKQQNCKIEGQNSSIKEMVYIIFGRRGAKLFSSGYKAHMTKDFNTPGLIKATEESSKIGQ